MIAWPEPFEVNVTCDRIRQGTQGHPSLNPIALACKDAGIDADVLHDHLVLYPRGRGLDLGYCCYWADDPVAQRLHSPRRDDPLPTGVLQRWIRSFNISDPIRCPPLRLTVWPQRRRVYAKDPPPADPGAIPVPDITKTPTALWECYYCDDYHEVVYWCGPERQTEPWQWHCEDCANHRGLIMGPTAEEVVCAPSMVVGPWTAHPLRGERH